MAKRCIIKRDGSIQDFQERKIKDAIIKSYKSLDRKINYDLIREIIQSVKENVDSAENKQISVEQVQDLVEIGLINGKEHAVAKSYILYRSKQEENRNIILQFGDYLEDKELVQLIKDLSDEFMDDRHEFKDLYYRFESFTKAGMDVDTAENMLVKAAAELTTKEAPKWENVAGRLAYYFIKKRLGLRDLSFYNRIKNMTENKFYGDYILENYTESEIDELESYLNYERNYLFNYSGLDLLVKRYLIRTNEGVILEDPQEMFMGIAMHLGIPETNNKLQFVKDLYDILSQLKVTVATPTMTNARKPFHQLSSCFIDTVPDSLDGIYRSIDNFAEVSKFGGGMGMYFGKVRAAGSDIRGVEGAAGGVIRWIRLANDTAVAVDQLGQRAGSVAVYLDAWHKDLPEFLQLRTNNGDDRMKAHDVFPAVAYPDLFWRLAKTNINTPWYLFDPHEIKGKMGFALEDYYGSEWEKKYYECIDNPELSRRTISVKDLIRLIIVSITETGTPFTFYRDAVNRMNPNKHEGRIYSSNLCTEIAQNMSPIETVEVSYDDDTVTTVTKAGDFVVCNLASLVLGRIDLKNKEELEYIISTIVRALDNVITLNYYPVPYAAITNGEYRAIGLGTSDYHHALAKQGITFSSDEHLEFMDKVYEDINYFAIKASSDISKEKGRYKYFEGSDWETGEYFNLRNYNDDRWQALQEKVKKDGLRNGYLLAVAPTSSTSIISGSSAGVDPIMKRYFLEEKKGSIVPRVAPGLNTETFWTYENAHEIDQSWVIKAAGVRQRHIDQAQSVNLYITTEYTMREIMNLLIQANELGVKSIYYVRGKSLEVDECDTCSA